MRNTSSRPFRTIAFLLALLIIMGVAGTATPAVAQDNDSEAEQSPAAESELATELPPPDLPSSNQQGYVFNIESGNSIDLDALPREAIVYALVWKEPSARRAERIAENLGIDGEVVDRGNDTFDITGEGEIYVSSDLVQYYSPDGPSEGELPDDEDSIAFAREWLRKAGLLPNDVDDGQIVARSEEANRVVVQFLPLEPANLLSAYPSAVVTLGPGGTVVEASIRWPSIERFDLYRLRDSKESWQEVQSGQAFLDVQVPDGIADENGLVEGEATYSSIEIGYTTSGLPGGDQFLQPVYIFTGRFTPEGSDRSYRIRAYVAAIANAGAPVG